MDLEFRAITGSRRKRKRERDRDPACYCRYRPFLKLRHAILEATFTIPNPGSFFLFIAILYLSLVVLNAPSGCVPEILVLITGSVYIYPDQMMGKEKMG
jgi:hypothetical protein